MARRSFSPIARPATRPPALDVSSFVELVDRVDQLPDPATGAFVVGPQQSPVGTILVEDRRICWAAVGGMGRRMTDILRRQSDPPLDTAVVEAAYRRCRESGRPIGEELVSSGLVSNDGLRRALRQHTAEAIGLLSGMPGVSIRFVEHKQRRFDARFSFTPTDLVLAIGVRADPSRACRTQARLADALEGGEGLGLGFLRSSAAAHLTPIASFRSGGLRAAELLALGAWSANTLDLTSATTGDGLVITSAPTGDSAAVWMEDGTVHVVLAEEYSALGYLVAWYRRTHPESRGAR